MANSALQGTTNDAIQNAKIFVVGAGGIGCELLKNLVLSGFQNIHVLDLDTIDVSNLNRQFLFQKVHVGKPKSLVARESVLKLCPKANIQSYHDNIFKPEYNMEFFKQFNLVLNALDNRSARNHVNRMCLAANIPLVESGSAGYLGQVAVIKRGFTECYECRPAPRQKTFPGCTIRNTPSEAIHCIVWAKYLFNQLFGEEDADQDVSPDSADPEAELEAGDASSKSLNKKPQSTREWAKANNYNPEKIFNKLFDSDITYLLSMDKLWEKRKAPTPVSWSSCSSEENDKEIDVQSVLSLSQNANLFAKSLKALSEQFKEEVDGGILVWDKDDLPALNFTASAANIRAHIFSITQKSVFEVKSMAGNIIPAIATTNAIVAGMIVLQAVNILTSNFDRCRNVYVRKIANPAKKLLVPCTLDPPNPDCYVCAEKPEISIELDINTFTVGDLKDKVLRSSMGMLAPDVEILDGRGTILLSSDEEDWDGFDFTRPLSTFGIMSGSRLRADDFLQNYDIIVNITHGTEFDDDETFRVLERKGEVEPQKLEKNKKDTTNNDEDDDFVIVEGDDTSLEKKRKLSANNEPHGEFASNAKRRKLSGDIDNTVLMID